MTLQKYILSQLKELSMPVQVDSLPQDDAEVVEAVMKALMSKKFRKFSIPEKNKAIIRAALGKNIKNKEPIKITWPFGGYKLWRLTETPEPDWAELFTMIYLAEWLKPVCAIYSPGAVLTFWEDEVVISKMNNISQSDLETYHKTFTNLIAFVNSYLPKNLIFDDFQEREQYESLDAFEKELAVEMQKLQEVRAKNPQPLSDATIRSIDLNVRVTPKQSEDPFWREKVDLMHYAYYNLQESKSTKRKAYTTDNIVVFTTFFEPNVIPVGTTKTSIAKFWVGVGALQRRGDGFIETILSPSQLEKAQFDWENVEIERLSEIGKNFHKVRVLK